MKFLNKNIKELNLNENDYINEIFTLNLSYKYNSNILYNDIKNKNNIPINNIEIIDVNHKGNCYFRVLSEFLYDTSENFRFLRNSIFTYCLENKNQIIEFQLSVEIRKNKYIPTSKYIEIMGT